MVRPMKHTAATKAKLSAMRRGEKNPFYGKKHTPETKAKLSAVLRQHAKNRTYEINPVSIRVPARDDLWYLAGIVDGEGSFSIRRGVRPIITIYNTDVGLMRWLKQTVGGAVDKGDRRGRRICYAWSIAAARDVYVLAVALQPILKIKKSAATTAILFLEEKYGKRL